MWAISLLALPSATNLMISLSRELRRLKGASGVSAFCPRLKYPCRITSETFEVKYSLYQATKGIPRKVNKLAMTALRLAAASKSQTVSEAILLDAAAEAML
jgi:hypothetical protein